MASPLVETKLLLPQPRGDAVARPRLTELLDQGRERRLTLVSAPAGFGKTMLLAKGLTQADRPAAAGRLGLPGGRRQPACSVLDLPRHRHPTGPARGRGRRLGAARDGPAVLGQRRGHPHQRAGHRGDRAGPRPGRLPPRRQPRPATERGLPARAPPASRAHAHQHPRRPGAAVGPPARPGRARRDPGRRPALHPGRGRDLLQRRRRARAHHQRHRRAGDAHRRLGGRPPAGGTLAAGAVRARGVHRCLRRRRPLHRGLPGRGGPEPPTAARCATSCSRPASWTG